MVTKFIFVITPDKVCYKSQCTKLKDLLNIIQTTLERYTEGQSNYDQIFVTFR